MRAQKKMGGAAWSTGIMCKGPNEAQAGCVRTGLTPGHESLTGLEESSVLGEHRACVGARGSQGGGTDTP